MAVATEPDLQTLKRVEQRVLWLATSIVHHANRVRENRSGVKVGGHQASSALMVSLMTALYFGVLEAPDRVERQTDASPVLHAINHLLGRLDRRYLTTLRAYGGLQSYPSRTKDPDPVDYSTGSVGLGATAPIWGALAHRYVAGHFDVPRGGRQIALIGDAELDEGACWEAIADPMVSRLGEVMWVVDLNRQSLDRVVPDIAAGRIAAMFEAAGWHTVMVKYGPLLRRRPDLMARIDAMPNEEYQRLLRADAPQLRERIEVARRRPRRRRAAGDLPRPRRPRPRGTARRLPPGGRGPRPPERGLRLHDQGLVAADRRPPREPFRAAQPGAVRRAGGQAGRGPGGPVQAARARLAGGGAVRGDGTTAQARRDPRRPRRGPARPRKTTPAPTSTQQAFGRFFVDLVREAPAVAERVVTCRPTWAPPRTSAAGSTRPALESRRAHRLVRRRHRHLVRWRESDHGRHIELGIAEVNLVGALGELGAIWSRDGQPLLPWGRCPDPFVPRALEPWLFGIYAGGGWILVARPGVTLAPRAAPISR